MQLLENREVEKFWDNLDVGQLGGDEHAEHYELEVLTGFCLTSNVEGVRSKRPSRPQLRELRWTSTWLLKRVREYHLPIRADFSEIR